MSDAQVKRAARYGPAVLEHIRATVRSDTVVLVRVAELNAGLIKRALDHGERFAVPAGAVGQVWRNGRAQARLAALLAAASVEVVSLDDAAARAAGQLCGARRTTEQLAPAVVGGLSSVVRLGHHIHDPLRDNYDFFRRLS